MPNLDVFGGIGGLSRSPDLARPDRAVELRFDGSAEGKIGQDRSGRTWNTGGMRSRSTAARTADLSTILAWIEAHLDEPLTLDRIAAHAGFSSFYFSRVFTARTGCSVMAHVRKLRLVRAARRLADDPSTGLAGLALLEGTDDLPHFAGLPPQSGGSDVQVDW